MSNETLTDRQFKFSSPKNAAEVLKTHLEAFPADPTEEMAKSIYDLHNRASEEFGEDFNVAFYLVLMDELVKDPESGAYESPQTNVLDQIVAEQAAGAFDEDPEYWNHEAYGDYK